jgi:hypothetical protein
MFFTTKDTKSTKDLKSKSLSPLGETGERSFHDFPRNLSKILTVDRGIGLHLKHSLRTELWRRTMNASKIMICIGLGIVFLTSCGAGEEPTEEPVGIDGIVNSPVENSNSNNTSESNDAPLAPAVPGTDPTAEPTQSIDNVCLNAVSGGKVTSYIVENGKNKYTRANCEIGGPLFKDSVLVYDENGNPLVFGRDYVLTTDETTKLQTGVGLLGPAGNGTVTRTISTPYGIFTVTYDLLSAGGNGGSGGTTDPSVPGSGGGDDGPGGGGGTGCGSGDPNCP